MKFRKLLSLIFPGLLASQITYAADGLSPEEITLAFINDYKAWNDYAMQMRESGDPKADWKIGKAYDEIILKYCRESLKYQPLAYGSEASHDPAKEKITKIDQSDSVAVVHTKHERKVGTVDLSNIYEYSFEKENNRWYLTSVAVVIDGERYEGL